MVSRRSSEADHRGSKEIRLRAAALDRNGVAVIRRHSRDKGRNQEEEAMKMSRRNILAAGGSTAIIAMVGSSSSSLAQSAATQTSLDLRTTSDTLGANARQAMIDIFRKKDPTVVDRHFAESFIQHDPNVADGPFRNCAVPHLMLWTAPPPARECYRSGRCWDIPRFGGARACKRLRPSVSISRSQCFRFMVSMRMATWFSVVSSSGAMF